MNKTGFALLFIIFAASVFAHETLEFPNLLGNLITPETGNLTIHMIPHTHDDIGWLKTVDEYYYGASKSIALGGVQYILDSVFPQLSIDSSRRFIYVEIGFFKRWWNEQTDAIKNQVKQFVQSGQLEFINGGYCMNDEADVYYEDSIDQMTWGHQFLLKNFGVTPTVGWHIDPFGHAAAQAALFAQMGFKAFFFGRIDYQDKTNRLNNSAMEMIWIPNTSQGIENAMFTHVNYYLYMNPSGFDFDVLGGDQPIRDDPTLEEYDVDQRADAFMAWFREMETSYKANHLFHTAGMDFEFMAAGMNFKNYDKLFKYIRSEPGYNVNVQYSTPSEYLGMIAPLGITYPQKTDDFFPYADVDSGYWTGYFTSRVAIKGLTRQEGKLLQAARRLATQVIWDQSSQFAVNNFNQVDQALGALEEALAIGQHHDAVTGTERQAVAEDYKLHYAVGDNGMKEGFLFPLLQEQIQKDLSLENLELSTCNLNTSTVFCNATYSTFGQGKSVLLTVFNSATTRQSTIRVKVPNGNVQVTRSTGEDLPTDIICANVTDTTDCDLFFTDVLQGLTTSYYYLNPSTTSNQVASQGLAYNSPYKVNDNQTFTASSMNSFSFSYCINGPSDCYSSAFTLAYNYYESYQADDGQLSGAYIFRPSQRTISGSIPYDSPLSGKVFVGKNLIQIQLNGAKTITAIRIYNDMTNGIEVQTFVDSINIADGQGKEIVMVVQTPSINNNKTFYTDSMGMELQERIVNYRPTWNLNVTQPVSGNYYPVQSTILIQDISSNESLAILPDRAQAGGSINNGEIELMLHRRLIKDDARGVGEPLNETDWDGQGMRQWMTHTLLFNKPGYLNTSYRAVQLNNDVANIVVLAPTSKTVYKDLVRGEKRLNDDLDARVKVICRPLSTSQFVLRFHNMDENESVNVPTQVFVNDKFSQHSVVEMSLTYNQKKSDMIAKRVNWNGLDLNNPAYANTDYLNSNQFLLRPFEIRTFMVNFSGAAAETVSEVVSEAVSEDFIDFDIIQI